MKEQKGFSPIIGVLIIAVVVISVAFFLLTQKSRGLSNISVINNKTEKTETQQTTQDTSALDPTTANSELDKINTTELDAELSKLDADTSTF